MKNQMNSNLKRREKLRYNRLPAYLVAFIIACVPATVFAKSQPKNTESTNTNETKPDGIQSKILSNGLLVVVNQNTAVPLVTIEIAVKNGAYTESPELSGLSHLFEHMFFKANAVIPNQEAYMRRVRELGISFNGTTSNERVNYFFTLPSTNFDQGLKFMYDAITSVKFDKQEFEREKEVVVGEVDRNESNPYYWLHVAMNRALFYKYPNRKDALGSRESVRAATTKMMDTMKATYYVPNNSALFISGDIKPEVAFAAAEKQFKKWKRGKDPFKKHIVPTHPPLTKNNFLIIEQDVNVPVLQMSWQGPSIGKSEVETQETFTADVLSVYLSLPESQFSKKLIDAQPAHQVGLSYYTQAHVGPIDLMILASPDKLYKAVDTAVAEIAAMTDPAYFKPELLQNAKDSLRFQQTYEKERASSFIHTLSFWWAVSSLSTYSDYAEKAQAVTPEALSEFVKKYLVTKNYVAGLLVSPATAKEFDFSKANLTQAVEKATKASFGSVNSGTHQNDTANKTQNP